MFIAPPVTVMFLVLVAFPILRLEFPVNVWFVRVVFSENRSAEDSITTGPVVLKIVAVEPLQYLSPLSVIALDEELLAVAPNVVVEVSPVRIPSVPPSITIVPDVEVTFEPISQTPHPPVAPVPFSVIAPEVVEIVDEFRIYIPSRFGLLPVRAWPSMVMEPVVAETVDPFSSIASSATGPAVKEMFPPVEFTVRDVRRSFPLPLSVMFPVASKFPVGVIELPPEIVKVPLVAVREPAPL
jgi:hypothetical protein